MRKIYSLAAIAAGCILATSAATAQTVSGCGTATIPKADANSVTKLSTQIACFTKAGAAASKAVVDRQSRLKAITAVPAPVPAPTPPPIAATPAPIATGPRFEVGINVAGSVYYNTERTFANLAQSSSAWKDSTAGWGNTAPAKLGANGYPIVDGQVLSLNPPQPTWAGQSVAVTCTWKGKAQLRLDGDARVSRVSQTVSFTWPGFDRVKNPTGRPNVMIYVTALSAADPFRDLDCREPGLKTVGHFDARAIDDLKPYKVLRFLDWSNTNGNPANVTWANRSTPDRPGIDGQPLETMVDLANAVGADAWFPIAWNADEDYVRRAGELVRDRLAPGRRAYFELSNEVWNFSFPVATQAMNEGLAAVPPLSTDKYSNNILRYAEKTVWFHKILTDVFKAEPARLVRVVSSQSDNSWQARNILAYRDTAKWVDALATAPYFGHSFFNAPDDKPTMADLDRLFAKLEATRVNAIAKAKENKAAAEKYGLRYITYEAGQHIIPEDAAAQNAVYTAMQRDPRMGNLYDRYLADWRKVSDDLFTVYSATGSISNYGAWGIREYAGQPIGETPKRRAVLDAVPVR